MTQSLKQIKNRIRSIESAKKVTGALEMVSVAKLSRIGDSLRAMDPYFIKIESILNGLLENAKGEIASPFFAKSVSKKRIGLCVVTSDSGLCGMYNSNIMRLADRFIDERPKDDIKLILIGKKGFSYFRKRGIAILNSYLGLNGRYSENVFDQIADYLIEAFISDEVDELYVAYTHFESSIRSAPLLKKFLGLDLNVNAEDARVDDEYILEPERMGILKELLPRYLAIKVKLMLLSAFASEHSARIFAMRNATSNARELLDGLILRRNKVRQANITQEIMEISAASEALKG